MKYCIFDPSQHFVGLQLVFPEADYYSLPQNQFTLNTKIYDWAPQDIFFYKYHFTYKENIEAINSNNYDILITGMPFYDGVRKGCADWQKQIHNFIFEILIKNNKFKKILFIDNYDYDYDPNDYIESIPNLIFLKRNYNKNIKYKDNVYSFPFVIFGHPTCMLWSILNDHNKYKDNISKIDKFFWSGTLFHHKDELGYPIDRNRTTYYNMIKNNIETYRNLPSEIFLKTMQGHKYSVDLYGVGDPNRRTLEILWTGSLIIQQKTNLLYPFEDGNLVPNELQFDTEEEFLSIKSMLKDEAKYNKYLKIQNERFDKYYTVEWLRNYIDKKIICYSNIIKLEELVDNTRTDKNTAHSYLNLYEELLNTKKDTAKNVLEIGINLGGSIKLWHDYFVNATVHGLDILDNHELWGDIKNNNRIMLYTSTDAYNPEFVIKTFINNNMRFDMILDDGPHTLESMVKFINLYSSLIADDGILIIEDIQSISWIEILKQNVPNDLKKYIEVYDLRHIKNRWDDIVFVINKK